MLRSVCVSARRRGRGSGRRRAHLISATPRRPGEAVPPYPCGGHSARASRRRGSRRFGIRTRNSSPPQSDQIRPRVASRRRSPTATSTSSPTSCPKPSSELEVVQVDYITATTRSLVRAWEDPSSSAARNCRGSGARKRIVVGAMVELLLRALASVMRRSALDQCGWPSTCGRTPCGRPPSDDPSGERTRYRRGRALPPPSPCERRRPARGRPMDGLQPGVGLAFHSFWREPERSVIWGQIPRHALSRSSSSHRGEALDERPVLVTVDGASRKPGVLYAPAGHVVRSGSRRGRRR